MPFFHIPSSFVSGVVSIKRGKITRKEKTNITTLKGEKKKNNLRERFIKKKFPMHVSLKKEKQPKTKTTIGVVLMFQFDDDEEKKTLQKR
jgi:hypothetical protein